MLAVITKLAYVRKYYNSGNLLLLNQSPSEFEFHHHSLKASTIASWSLPVGVAVSKSSDRDRNSTPALCRPSITCRPQVSPASGGAKLTV